MIFKFNNQIIEFTKWSIYIQDGKFILEGCEYRFVKEIGADISEDKCDEFMEFLSDRLMEDKFLNLDRGLRNYRMV